MKRRKRFAFLVVIGALAVAGAGWKWAPHHSGPAAKERIAGWTWDAARWSSS